jgi:hypothetical protein
MSEIPFTDPTPYVGLPPKAKFTDRDWFQALDQFARVFAIRPGERVLMLTDPLLDTRVVDAVTGLARARGATVTQYMAPHTSLPGVPDEVKPIIEKADFIVSTWFCSIEDPFNVAMRRRGQRWVKITYFRDLDLLKTPQARFPIELVGEIIRATEKRLPRGRDFDLRFTDARGSDLVIGYTRAMREAMFAGNWSAKLEYLYMDLGSISNSVVLPTAAGFPLGANVTSRVTDSIIRAGINYHFSAGPGPVVARY